LANRKGAKTKKKISSERSNGELSRSNLITLVRRGRRERGEGQASASRYLPIDCRGNGLWERGNRYLEMRESWHREFGLFRSGPVKRKEKERNRKDHLKKALTGLRVQDFVGGLVRCRHRGSITSQIGAKKNDEKELSHRKKLVEDLVLGRGKLQSWEKKDGRVQNLDAKKLKGVE